MMIRQLAKVAALMALPTAALPANQTYDLVIVPAIPRFQNWNVTVKCDNGTTTNTSEFF